MTDNDDKNPTRISSDNGPSPVWWETAEDHRNALHVLQLRLRREILKFIASGQKSRDQVMEEFDLSAERADYHLCMLRMALVIEQTGEVFRATPTGFLYLENVEARR